MTILVFPGKLSEDFVFQFGIHGAFLLCNNFFIYWIFVMIFGMCRFIFVGFDMELVLKCAQS